MKPEKCLTRRLACRLLEEQRHASLRLIASLILASGFILSCSGLFLDVRLLRDQLSRADEVRLY